MAWKAVMTIAELQQNNRQTMVVEGNKLLFIWNDEQVHAVQAQCPHLKMPLAKGKITDDCALVCPFHKSAFDVHTGAVKCWSPWPPAVGTLLGKLSKPKALRVYPTRIEKEQIFVDVEKVMAASK